MFTGIIEQQGVVLKTEKRNGGILLSVRIPKKFRAKLGESISVNGVCSTVAKLRANTIAFDYMPETLRKTNLKNLSAGEVVSLESSLTLNTPIGGHILLGHVDAVGIVKNIQKEGNAKVLRVTAPSTILELIAPKGSVALEGVSLTIVEKFRDGFSVSLIPHTLAKTNLRTKRIKDTANIECDMIAKYLKEIVDTSKRNAKKGKS